MIGWSGNNEADVLEISVEFTVDGRWIDDMGWDMLTDEDELFWSLFSIEEPREGVLIFEPSLREEPRT